MAAVRGLAEFEHALRQRSGEFLDRAARALYEEARIDLEKAKTRTPRESGALQKSGRVHGPVISRNTVAVTMSFGTDEDVNKRGQPSSRYAEYQHENLHYKHPNGGQAKFLESVINESKDTMLDRVAARMNASAR